MKICVIGAGAIGGMMAVRLGLAGEDVTVIARGAKLEAIRKNGFKLIWEDDTEHVAKVEATDKIGEVGPQDVIILAVKAHYLDQVAKEVPAITGPDTMIVTVQNGIPWWYFHKHGGEFDGRQLESLDPAGVLSKNIDGDKIIGCIAYPAATVEAPGVIHHVEG
ncbi:MAG: ketopantoate reductase family protein, partial [Rhodospirillales bacterium]